MHFRNPNLYDVFLECVKKISAPNLSWRKQDNGDLVCVEKHVPHETQSELGYRKQTVKQIMKILSLKMTHHEYSHVESEDKSSTTYTFTKKPLLDKINAVNSRHQFLMRRITELAQETDEKRQARKP